MDGRHGSGPNPLPPPAADPPRAPAGAGSHLEWALGGAGLVAAAIWIWLSWCIFPLRSWNDIRLAPTFALSLGQPVYPGVDGAASTWMYGPLPVWLNWPATWAADPGTALVVAGGINLLVSLVAIVAVCLGWPVRSSPTVSPACRLLAVVVTIAIWPWACWQFLQADNYAVGFGLLANLVLVRSPNPRAAWLAAGLAGAGLMCKQTSLAVPLAQMAWLAATAGTAPALRHAGRLLVTGCGWLALLLVTTDPQRAWFTAILTPAGLPWADAMLDRFLDLLPHLAVHTALPIGVWFWLKRQRGTADLLLPTLTWLVAWLPGLASAFKTGGTLNSLQGFPLWLPAAAVVALASLGSLAAPRRGQRLRLVIAVTAIFVLAARIATRPVAIWRPMTVAYDDAVELSRRFPEQIWFPWNPLITVYAEGRLYEVEDGLYVRSVTGRPVPRAVSRRHLPPRFAAVVVSNQGSTWGIAERLLPGPCEPVDLGNWTLWRPRGGPAIVTEDVGP